MKVWLIAALALASSACAAAEQTPTQAEAETQPPPIVQPPPPLTPPPFTLDPTIPPPLASGTTQSVPLPALAALAPPDAPQSLTLECAGAFFQGGTALCRTMPGVGVVLDGQDRGRADAQGWFVVGFDRDSPRESRLEVIGAEGMNAGRVFTILPREFSVQRVDGLPPQTVTPTDPAIVARLARDRETKNRGFSSRAAAQGWLDSFIWPVEGRISGSWGNQRVLNGVPRSPHYGVDIAMPEGTPIRAPAGGIVSLAEPDLYLE
ncbi:MAG: M23 family metallopeptidase, partial [Hyphomonadaceae bacterium]